MHDPLDDRLRVLDAKPDSCSLTMGHDELRRRRVQQPLAVRLRPLPLGQEREVVPEFETVRPSATWPSLRRLLATATGRPYGGQACTVDLVMGVPGGMPGTADALVAGRRRPARAGRPRWSATGIGRTTLPVALAALAKGGHLRVGMEDVLTLISRGVPVEQQRPAARRAGRRRSAHSLSAGR